MIYLKMSAKLESVVTLNNTMSHLNLVSFIWLKADEEDGGNDDDNILVSQ